MQIKESKFVEYISRLQNVQKAIREMLLKKGPPVVAANIFSQGDQDAPDKPDPIERCLKEAEKLVNEGKVMAAIEKQNECEKLIANSQP